MTPRWERLEEWLFDHDRDLFTARDVADSMGTTPAEGSRMLRAYLQAQRSPKSTTLYVLKREGRTSNAAWSVGQRTADARVIGATLFEDVSVKVRTAFQPDLDRLATRNPRAARYAGQKIEAVMDGALKVLAASVDVMIEED